jgi:hypothetical protein
MSTQTNVPAGSLLLGDVTDDLELSAALAATLLEYRRLARREEPPSARPIAGCPWRLLARWDQAQGTL